MPEIRIAKLMTRPNSLNIRPTTPPMNSTGMKTATSDSVIETIVKPTSLEPLNAASMACFTASVASVQIWTSCWRRSPSVMMPRR